jgi:hypothetical protein
MRSSPLWWQWLLRFLLQPLCRIELALPAPISTPN